MSTAEIIYERAKNLPDALQSEALHDLDYLALRQQEVPESFRQSMDEAARGEFIEMDDALQELRQP